MSLFLQSSTLYFEEHFTITVELLVSSDPGLWSKGLKHKANLLCDVVCAILKRSETQADSVVLVDRAHTISVPVEVQSYNREGTFFPFFLSPLIRYSILSKL